MTRKRAKSPGKGGRKAARAALASEASGQRGDSSEVRAPDTRPEPGSSARAALASEASGQRGDSSEVRAPDTRPEPGSSARAAKPAGRDPLDRFVDAAARALALPLEPAWKPMVKANLEVTLRLASLFADFPLPDDAEPAPVFKA